MGRKFALLAFVLVGIALFAYRDLVFPAKSPTSRFIGTEVINARIQDRDGTEVKLHDLIVPSGKRSKAILAMWATWCEPCVRELPVIQEKVAELRQLGIEVYLVNYDGPVPEKSLPEVKAWLVTQKINLPVYYDFGEEVLKSMDITGLPFAVGLNEDKKISWMEMGEIEWDKPGKIRAMFH